jgi:ABC-2 type transport system permease protein
MSGAARALARRTLADSRVRTLSFAALFAFATLANVVGYRKTYPTVADRIRFAIGFGANKSVRLFYGVPHDLLSVGGYTAWRAGGMLSIFAGMWGVLAAVRAMRAEEDAGRQELVLAGRIGRGAAFAAALAGIGVGAAVLWLAAFVGLVAARLPAGGSAYLALAVVAVVPVFVGVGAVASQVAPNRRLALGIGSAALAVAFVVRVAADTSSGVGWLRWATPLGWIEELRAFAGPRPAVLLLPAAASLLLLGTAAALAVRRDVGRGLFHDHDSAPPDRRLLGSPTAQALRGERGMLLAWLLGTAGFAFVLGVVSASVSPADISKSLQQQLEKLGLSSVVTPAGYLGLTFLFFIFAVSLFCCSQVAAARREEAEQQLETLLALPVARRRWLTGRIALAAVAAAVLSLVAGMLAWIGAASQNVDVALLGLVKAGANCLPTALLFLGIGMLAFAVRPRAGTGIAYGVTTLAFVWELFGAILGAPSWTLNLSPFHHIGLVPAQPFRPGAAAVMLAIAAASSIAAVLVFERRDLTGQ